MWHVIMWPRHSHMQKKRSENPAFSTHHKVRYKTNRAEIPNGTSSIFWLKNESLRKCSIKMPESYISAPKYRSRPYWLKWPFGIYFEDWFLNTYICIQCKKWQKTCSHAKSLKNAQIQINILSKTEAIHQTKTVGCNSVSNSNEAIEISLMLWLKCK